MIVQPEKSNGDMHGTGKEEKGDVSIYHGCPRKGSDLLTLEPRGLCVTWTRLYVLFQACIMRGHIFFLFKYEIGASDKTEIAEIVTSNILLPSVASHSGEVDSNLYVCSLTRRVDQPVFFVCREDRNQFTQDFCFYFKRLGNLCFPHAASRRVTNEKLNTLGRVGGVKI